jgi:hypothetical protein
MKERLQPPGHLVPAAMLRATIQRTRVFTLKNSELCRYNLACCVGLSEQRAVIFLNGINRLPFVIETRCVLFQVEPEFMFVYIIQVNFMRQRVDRTLLPCPLGSVVSWMWSVNLSFEGRMFVVATMF